MPTPIELGYTFPAEWEPHRAIWLSFPRNVDTWEDRFDRIYPAYFEFIKTAALSEKVCINAHDAELIDKINQLLEKYNVPTENITLYPFPTNDSWCRDHGPAFVVNDTGDKAIVNWEYNAWGGKYPPYNDDNRIPLRIAAELGITPIFSPGIVMEGGAIEVNGKGTLLTSRSCLLNPNRNPHLSQAEIEKYLRNYYGQEQILWVSEGIVGDDTDGHIDDTTRFVNEDTVLTVVETDRTDANFEPLRENLQELKEMRLLNGQKLNIVELPMPTPKYDNGERLPASYANFYISNQHVIVPIYACKNDDKALQIIEKCFPTRTVVGIDSSEIIWGLGSYHCLSQQEPQGK